MDGYRAAATLLVSCDADKDEVRRAFRARAKQLHPDTGPDGSESAFVELREAFEQLMATAPAPSSLQRPPQPRPSSRFEVLSSPSFHRAIDVTDTKPRPIRRSERAVVATCAPGDTEASAAGQTFSRHLAVALTAPAGPSATAGPAAALQPSSV